MKTDLTLALNLAGKSLFFARFAAIPGVEAAGLVAFRP